MLRNVRRGVCLQDLWLYLSRPGPSSVDRTGGQKPRQMVDLEVATGAMVGVHCQRAWLDQRTRANTVCDQRILLQILSLLGFVSVPPLQTVLSGGLERNGERTQGQTCTSHRCTALTPGPLRSGCQGSAFPAEPPVTSQHI